MFRRLLAITVTGLLMPATAAAMPAPDVVQPRIVGGSPTDIQQVPYQVALLDPQHNHRLICGGSILDATHVVTAAHCVTDDAGAAYPPAETEVLAGTKDIQDRVPPAQLVQLSAVAVHPEYDPVAQTDDVALLTLQTPLLLDAAVDPTDAKALIAPASATPPPGTAATISGWGTTAKVAAGAANTDPTSRYLQSATVNVLADDAATCGAPTAYDFTAFEAGELLCAAAADRDSCQGDSGGPLQSGGQLIGIVAFGEGCADPAYAGVYTEVAAPTVHDFITGDLPMPAADAPPSLEGTPLVGETLTCNPGRWSSDPAFRYEFYAAGPPATILQGFSATRTYTLGDGDANRTVGCVVEATRSSGSVRTEPSNTVGPIQRRPVVTTVTVTTPAPPTDTTAPASTVVARRCTRTTCRVDVLVEDPGYSTGVRGIELRYVSRYRVGCRKNGRVTTCVRKRRGTASAVALGHDLFAVRLRKLRAGSSTVATITAVDRAGNRERIPTTTVLRTTKPKARPKTATRRR